MKLNGLDLFSGIGGISLALKPWVNTVAYCEIDPYCQAVLLERMLSNDLDIAPIWDDVTTLNRALLDTKIDIILGGFPCQDISIAGQRAGIKSNTRSGLFFEIMRLVGEFQPTFIFLENVPNITSDGLDVVLREIAQARYDARWLCLSAAEVGSPHKRDRWWLLAHSRSKGLEGFRGTFRNGSPFPTSAPNGLDARWPVGCGRPQEEWEPRRILESRMGRMSHGISHRVDRLQALGNSVVPQAAQRAFIELIKEPFK